MDTKAAIAHLKSEGYDVYEGVPDVSEMTDEQLRLWRTKIVAWGQDMRRDQTRLSEMIDDEIERRESAVAKP
ncbi:hypothetical protein [Roseibium album]|uniref:hypothetical protein n=1 Tax=Roseibium album TaxID=311410 RepID=UPI0024934615|nr:hypothetical protein [Roseibium album]